MITATVSRREFLAAALALVAAPALAKAGSGPEPFTATQALKQTASGRERMILVANPSTEAADRWFRQFHENVLMMNGRRWSQLSSSEQYLALGEWPSREQQQQLHATEFAPQGRGANQRLAAHRKRGSR